MRRALARQRVVNRLAEQGRLRVVALYSSPEEDEAAWRASLGEYPDGWIAAYDAGAQVHYRAFTTCGACRAFTCWTPANGSWCKGAVTAEQIAGALEKAISR